MKSDTNETQKLTQRLNVGMLMRLVVITGMMFAFGYGMVPLYRKLCEVTGLNVLTPIDPAAANFARNTQVDSTRTITVEFDANASGPWKFKPKRNSLVVHPGELTSMNYEITNPQDRSMQAQAIPSYAPQEASGYFHKLECFCFKQQTLAAHQSREFPVVFVVDPKLPADVKEITLSYTFFEVGQGVTQHPENFGKNKQG
jgi:cytochrome c oxidase assembly protein subunit 11